MKYIYLFVLFHISSQLNCMEYELPEPGWNSFTNSHAHVQIMIHNIEHFVKKNDGFNAAKWFFRWYGLCTIDLEWLTKQEIVAYNKQYDTLLSKVKSIQKGEHTQLSSPACRALERLELKWLTIQIKYDRCRDITWRESLSVNLTHKIWSPTATILKNIRLMKLDNLLRDH